jgi:tRNA pseudouridine38-40 synthase
MPSSIGDASPPSPRAASSRPEPAISWRQPSSATRLKLTLEYDGTGFHGWAAQPGLRTIEGELRAALDGVFPGWRELAVAGRTDTGVHALANVSSVEVEGGPPAERAAEALNARLPAEVSVLACEQAAPDFHARHAARSRAYRYRIFRRRERSPFEERRSWWYPRPLDEESLAESADLLLGEHDFRAFTPAETQHKAFVRNVLGAAWHRRGEALEFEIEADSFLRHMVRTLVGTMVEQRPEQVARLLDGGHGRSDAGSTAPPWGLYLERVGY